MIRRLALSVTALVFAQVVWVGGASALSGVGDDEGVVLTGARLPRLLGAWPQRVVAYRQLAAAWQRVPVQVDQRFIIDMAAIYHETAPSRLRIEVYADRNTWVGSDPNPRVDRDDEIAVLAASSGRVTRRGPPGSLGGRFTRIVLGSGTRKGAIWVGVAGSDPGPSPSSGIRYRFRLLSGAYRGTYRLQAGPNPEDSTVTTPYYRRHFSDRWLTDGLRIGAGVNVLEREKFLFYPGYCGRSEDTFDTGEGAFEANISGPVRAIRSFIGANSGPWTQRTEIFWPRYEQDITTLRVHAIPNIMDFFALRDTALGMRLTTSTDPAGVAIDGMPDEGLPTSNPSWFVISGVPGTLTEVPRTYASFTFHARLYELDQMTPTGATEVQCTGDKQAIGDHGTWIDSPLPNTDPTNGAAESMRAINTLFFETHPITAQHASQRAAQVDHPLLVHVG